MQNLYITEDKNKQFLLQKLRKKGDFSSSVMGYSEFLKTYFFDYGEEALFYIVQTYHVTKEVARIYLEHLYYLIEKETNRPRILFLQALKKELAEQKLLHYQPMFLDYLKTFTIYFYHISLEDAFFQRIVSQLRQITTVHIESVKGTDREVVVFHAKDIQEEVVGVCTEIIHLLRNGVPISSIYLSNLNDEYRSSFSLYGKLFHLPFSFLTKKNLFSTVLVQTFWRRIREDWSKVFEDLREELVTEEEYQVYNQLLSVCNPYLLFEKDEVFYSFLKETLEQIQVPSDPYQNSVREFAYLTMDVEEDAYIFLVGANQGSFPVTLKDLNYFNDEDMVDLSLSRVCEKNQIMKEQARKRVGMYPNLVLSYKDCSLEGEFYPASLLDEFNLIKKEFSSMPFSYSHLFNVLTLGKELDFYQKYGVFSPSLNVLGSSYDVHSYRSYDNTFHQFFLPDKTVDLLSYSSIDSYARCPFRFYAAHVLKLKTYKPTFAIQLGSFCHYVLQKAYEEDFVFETACQEARELMGVLTKREDFFVNKITKQMQTFLDVLKKQESYSSLNHVLCEYPIEVELPYQFRFKGVLDKIYFDEAHAVIVDYKTGNASLDLKMLSYGIGMQLPIYYSLLHHSKMFHKKVIGFYLQRIMPPVVLADLTHTKMELEEKSFQLKGYSSSLESDLSLFDSGYQDSKVIQGMKVGKNGFYSYAKVLSEEQMEQMGHLVEEKIQDITKNIFEQNFPIAPKRIGGSLKGCEFCPYAAICYKQEKDILDCEEVSPDFLGGEEDGLDSRATVSN